MSASKVGPNEQCPCGSGRKFKRCCQGKAATELAPAASVTELAGGSEQGSKAAGLRERLEDARLILLALFRALDRMYTSDDQLPQRELKRLFDLDADFAEALWALDQPPGKLDQRAMIRDTMASLDDLPGARARFFHALPTEALARLQEILSTAHGVVRHEDAYQSVPGRDPDAEPRGR